MPARANLKIQDHELIVQIGQGSYGDVWLARSALGRFRAVKVVFRDRFKEAAPFEREFAGIRRFEPVSRSHEALVDVLQVGDARDQGHFYYIMELADDVRTGQAIDPNDYTPNTLTQQIEARDRLPHQECIALGLALSNGLAHLHESGLIHRDIKPSNVVFIDGKPKIVDIGLVAAINDAESWVGTQGFIPPEGPGTAQADIYSLGKLLYEASTGRDRQQFPELPTQLGDDLSEREFLEFNEVLVKACHPIANHRYRRMRDLHSELQVLAEGQSLQRLRALERRIRFGKKAAAMILIAILLAALPIFHFTSLRKTKNEARQRQVGTEVAYGSRDVSDGSHLTALPRFADALRLDLGDPTREAIHRIRIESSLLFAPRLLHTIDLGSDVQNVEFSPDGSRIVATRYFHEIHLFDAATAAPIEEPFATPTVRSSVLSPDGRFLVGAAEYSILYIRDLEKKENREGFRHPDRVMSVAFHPSLNRLLTACDDGIARVWDFETGQVATEFKGHAKGILDAKFSPRGDFVLTTSRDSTARIWNAATGESLFTFTGHRDWILHGNFHPFRDWVVTSSHDGSARVWRFPSGEPVGRPLLHRDSAANARFSPDGRFILTAGHDGAARLWDCLTWHPASRNAVLPHSAKVKDAAFAPDGRRIVTACFDGTVRIWELSEVGLPFATLPGIVSGNGEWAANQTNQTVLVRRVSEPESAGHAIALPSVPEEIAIDYDGNVLSAAISTPAEKSLHFWGVNKLTGCLGAIPVLKTNTLASAINSADGQLAAVLISNTVLVVDFKNAATNFLTHTNQVTIAAFSPNGQSLASLDQFGAHLWDLKTPGQSRHIPLARRPKALRFSPDGSKLAVATLDVFYNPCFAQIFDAASGAPLTGPLDHDDGVTGVAFSESGELLITSGEDLRAQVWKVSAGARVGTPLLHDLQVRLAAFCAQDRFIATSDRGGFVRLFESSTGDPISPSIAGGSLRPSYLALNGNRLLSIERSGKTTAWTLPAGTTDSRPLLAWIDYLTSRAKLSNTNFASLKSMPVFSAYLKVTPEQIAAWHLREAQEARAENNEAAAQLHLAAALKAAPESARLHRHVSERPPSLAK